MQMLHTVLSLLTLVGLGHAFPWGPPATPYVCKEMFPEGHGVDSRMDEPPYEIELTQNMYTANEEIRVTVQSLHGYFLEGFLIQARRANCSHPDQQEPVGTFQLLQGESYLKTMACDNRMASTVSHAISKPLDHAVFKWFAPSQPVGHLYFVATVVKDKTTFWTRVYSVIVRDMYSKIDPKYARICPARVYLDRGHTHLHTTPGTTTRTPAARSGTTRTSYRAPVGTFLVLAWLILL